MTATYTAPKTMSTDPLMYSDWNTYVRDNIEYLKQQADTRLLIIPVIGEADTLTTGDGKKYVTIPSLLNGYNLTGVAACVYTPASTSDLPTIMIHNLTDTVDMLSVAITIDATEYSSYTATTAATINTATDDVATGDRLRIDVDLAGASTKGLEIHLQFQKP